MHRSEIRDATTCAECGLEIVPGRDRSYAFGPESFLCPACATRRGGVYDEAQDRWIEAADTRGLAASGD